VTLACSGADAFALCAGAVLAYPAAASKRVAGVAGAIALLLILNTLRIGTLGRLAASPAFDLVHVYVWPAILLLVLSAYVFAWMQLAGNEERSTRQGSTPMRRFAWLTAALLVMFTAAAPFYLHSDSVLRVATFVAQSASLVLQSLGVAASADANILWTPRGGFLVTQECIASPLIPVYVAAAMIFLTTWRSRTLALLAAIPIFAGLGIARLLVVALPASLIESPLFFVHAFYQLLLAAVIVCAFALWRHGAGRKAWQRALLAIAAGIVAGVAADPVATSLLSWTDAAAPALSDPQGAIAMLPSFQFGFYVALAIAALTVFNWRPLGIGLALLALSAGATLAALPLLDRYVGFVPEVRDIRAWAVAAPLLLIFAVVRNDQPRR
jgi:exosortase/archaeosortase family protein